MDRGDFHDFVEETVGNPIGPDDDLSPLDSPWLGRARPMCGLREIDSMVALILASTDVAA